MTIGYVYKLVCKDINAKEIYVGSTMNINQRRRAHKNTCNNEKNEHYNYPVYQYIRENGGWENWESVIVETVEYNEKHELKLRERFHLEELKATLNKQIPTRTKDEYRQDTKEDTKITDAEYKLKNKEAIIIKNKEYYNNHIEAIKTYHREYQQKNKETLAIKQAEKYTCNCGKTSTIRHKSRHEMSRKHLLWFIKQ